MDSTKLKVKECPWFVIVIAMIFPLFLYLNNLGQATLKDLWQPVLYSMLLGVLIFGILYLLIRNIEKAGLITVLLEFFIFSYGHVYIVVKNLTLFGILIGRHRVLVLVYLTLIAVLTWLILTRLKNLKDMVRWISSVAFIILVYQLIRVSYYEFRIAVMNSSSHRQPALEASLSQSNSKRDIYLIVLDSYMRYDALKEYYDFDNSSFIRHLEQLGFYVADCSRSNYAYTLQAMTSELNLDYLDQLDLTYEDSQLSNRFKNSKTRQLIEENGYHFVFFETGYPPIEIKDADLFVKSKAIKKVQDFEFLYLKTTFFLFPYDLYERNNQVIYDATIENYVNRVKSALTGLQAPIESESPVFVYAHIISPHSPDVFTRSGTINPDWSEDKKKAAAGTYAYLDDEILKAVDFILSNADQDPIIIIQADHGGPYIEKYRNLILNAYYLPNGGESLLYSTISPINTFRIIFDQYFGFDYPLLPDEIYYSPEGSRYDFSLVEDPFPYCSDQD